MQEFYVGLMSGTSADGVDAVIMSANNGCFKVIASHSLAFKPHVSTKIKQLFEPAINEIDRLGQLDRELAIIYAQCINELIQLSNINTNDVVAVGCHGQTIRHRPNQDLPFSLQIGDATLVAQLTGIDVISDFRKSDISQGGQGAPLAPGFHHAIFGSKQTERFVVNIGGIANITHLPVNEKVTGWDTGPGNGLMDAWIEKVKDEPFDNSGDWAKTGDVDNQLLSSLGSHKYFARKPPKSTGKEEFTLSWVEQELKKIPHQIRPACVQATLAELTATNIAQTINGLMKKNYQQKTTQPAQAFICGGGAYNHHLVNRIAKHSEAAIQTTDTLGLNPMLVEAAAFAWLAHQFKHRLPGNIPSVTGAKRPVVLGSLTPYYNNTQ